MVYEGIINNKKLPEIRKQLVKRAKRKQAEPIEIKLCFLGISLAAQALRKQDPVEFLLEDKNYNLTETTIDKLNREITGKEKEKVIKDTVKDARRAGNIFYLCSKHDDCAEDHKDYQGKIYVDEKAQPTPQEWEYIKQNGIQSFQWVTFRPVWMTTRPHCRHYFKSLKTEDVLNHSVSQLIRNHRMHHKEGKYEMQTIRYKTGKETLRAYEERLRYHEYLYAIHKTETLRKLISKDKMLIKKWRDYLKTLN